MSTGGEGEDTIFMIKGKKLSKELSEIIQYFIQKLATYEMAKTDFGGDLTKFESESSRSLWSGSTLPLGTYGIVAPTTTLLSRSSQGPNEQEILWQKFATELARTLQQRGLK
jgi:hypothetical protein